MTELESAARLAGYRDGCAGFGADLMSGGIRSGEMLTEMIARVDLLGALLHGDDGWQQIRQAEIDDDERASHGMAGTWLIEDDEERELERQVWVRLTFEDRIIFAYCLGWRDARPGESRHICS